MLDVDKGGKYANDGAGAYEHDEHPDVELDGGPVVFVYPGLDYPAGVDEGGF